MIHGSEGSRLTPYSGTNVVHAHRRSREEVQELLVRVTNEKPSYWWTRASTPSG
jgi:hypothetical protein